MLANILTVYWNGAKLEVEGTPNDDWIAIKQLTDGTIAVFDAPLAQNPIWHGNRHRGNNPACTFAVLQEVVVRSLQGEDRITDGGSEGAGSLRDPAEGASRKVTIESGEDNDDIDGFDFKTSTLDGGTGDDRIYGGTYNDLILGGPGEDTIFGSGGDDIIWGQGSDDTINCGSGNDMADGDGWINPNTSGRDTIIGGLGNDRLYGGE
jgi:Ca2+-binding RTX toxin-like protein